MQKGTKIIIVLIVVGIVIFTGYFGYTVYRNQALANAFYIVEDVNDCLQENVFVGDCIKLCEDGNSKYEEMNRIPNSKCRDVIYEIADISN